jgi:hypothetical protein
VVGAAPTARHNRTHASTLRQSAVALTVVAKEDRAAASQAGGVLTARHNRTHASTLRQSAVALTAVAKEDRAAAS